MADRCVDNLKGQCLEICICTVNDHLIRNKNVQLSKAEFLGFLHPEVEPHMGDILVSETMADLDKVSN